MTDRLAGVLETNVMAAMIAANSAVVEMQSSLNERRKRQRPSVQRMSMILPYRFKFKFFVSIKKAGNLSFLQVYLEGTTYGCSWEGALRPKYRDCR